MAVYLSSWSEPKGRAIGSINSPPSTGGRSKGQEIPREVQHRCQPIHFRLPRNDRTSYTHPNQEHDFPLDAAYVGLFDPSRTDLAARRRAVLDLRKAMRGCRVWTPTARDFRGVIVTKGSAKSFPAYSMDGFDSVIFV